MKIYRRTVFALLTMLAFSTNDAHSQKLQVDPEVTVGKLPNGFTYYVRKNTSQKKRVTMYLANKSGSILETDGQRGLAHFVEHMSFNGTKNFPGSTLVDFLEKAGVRFGADLNAYTSFEETVYQLPITIDKPEMLDKGLQVLRDWSQEATLDPKEIDKERGVILEEKRLRTGAQQRIQAQTFPYLVNHSLYAEREPIGTEEVLRNFKREEIHSFYSDWYRPDLQAIIVVGDVDVKQTIEKIKALFSDLKMPAVPKPRPIYTIDLKGKNQFIVATDNEAQGTIMQVMIKFPHKKLITNSDYLDFVKENLFNLLLSNRLRSISQKNSANYLAANASLGAFMSNIDAFNVLLSARPGELEKGFGALWGEINKIRTFGFDLSELEQAKSQYMASEQSMVSEIDKKASAAYAQEYVRHFTKDEAIPGQLKEAQLTETYLGTISQGHMLQMAKTYVVPTNRDVFIVAPTSAKSSLPTEEQVNGWFEKYGGEQLSTIPIAEQYKKEPERSLIDSEPKPGKIVSANKSKELGTTEMKLSNGIRIILKPTSFKNDEINFSAFSMGGSSLYSDHDFRSAEFAAGLIANAGVANFSSEQLRQKLNGKQVSVIPFISERTEGISGYSNVKDLETALQLTYLYFTNPRKDTASFNAVISRSLATLQSQVNSPEKVFSDSLNALLSNNNPRRKSLDVKQIQDIAIDKVYEIYGQRFANASDFTFVFVGNIDPEKLKPLIERYIASLPSNGKMEKARDLGINIPEGNIKKTVYSGIANKSSVQLIFSGPNVCSAESNLELRAIRFILGLRMNQRLREQESGVYSPQVSLNVGRIDNPRFVLSIQFGCAPENVERLVNAAKEELMQIKSKGVSKDDFEKFIAEERVALKNQMETNGFWLAYLSGQIQQEQQLNEILGFSGLMDSLTPTKLTQSFTKYLDGKNLIQFVLMPEAAAKK